MIEEHFTVYSRFYIPLLNMHRILPTTQNCIISNGIEIRSAKLTATSIHSITLIWCICFRLFAQRDCEEEEGKEKSMVLFV